MTFPQCMNAMTVGVPVVLDFRGQEITVLISSCEYRRKVDAGKNGNRLIGDRYECCECRELNGGGVILAEPRLLTVKDDKIKQELDKMMEGMKD